jgi:hypothetical protein
LGLDGLFDTFRKYIFTDHLPNLIGAYVAEDVIEARDAEALQRIKVARAALTRADPSRAKPYFIRYNMSQVPS